MEKILEKFSLYEFFVYFIPGTTLLGIFMLQFYCYIESDIIKECSFFFTFVLFFISYFLGIILHEVGELLQKYIVFKKNKLPSFIYAQCDSNIFSDEEIQNYKELAMKKYNLDISDSSIADLFFQRLRTSLKSIDSYNDAEIINNNYGICRSYLALSSILFLILFLKLILCFSILNLLILILNILIILILFRRLKRFGETYVKKVLRLGYFQNKEE